MTPQQRQAAKKKRRQNRAQNRPSSPPTSKGESLVCLPEDNVARPGDVMIIGLSEEMARTCFRQTTAAKRRLSLLRDQVKVASKVIFSDPNPGDGTVALARELGIDQPEIYRE